MEEELKAVLSDLNLVQSLELRDGCVRVWTAALQKGGWTPRDLQRMPFTLLLPPDVGVSLLDHTKTVTKLCLAAWELLNGVGGLSLNRDILVAGALLHDVGKVLEMREKDGVFSKSPYGRLLRHPFSGAALCLEQGLPPEVAHIVALHAREGDQSWRCPEAVIVHYADFMAFESLKGLSGEVSETDG